VYIRAYRKSWDEIITAGRVENDMLAVKYMGEFQKSVYIRVHRKSWDEIITAGRVENEMLAVKYMGALYHEEKHGISFRSA
jgi:hypothetical protein